MAEPVKVFSNDPNGFEHWRRTHEFEGFYYVKRSRLVHRVGLCNHWGDSTHAVYASTSLKALLARTQAEFLPLFDCRDCARRGLRDDVKARRWISASRPEPVARPRRDALVGATGAAFLLLWDGTKERWAAASENAAALARGERPTLAWYCGARRHIPIGSRVFVKRTRVEPRGIVAAGITVAEVDHSDDGNTVEMELTAMVDPYSAHVLSQKTLSDGALGGVNWNTQGGGMAIPPDAADELERRWRLHVGRGGALVAARSGGLSADMLREFEVRTRTLPQTTEAERLVVQRVGQDIFREGLLEYWQGRCALTGLAVPELLRASHIKPWAECDDDDERLDVFNGLLLAPHLDAAFDQGFFTFDDRAEVMVSAKLSAMARGILCLDEQLELVGLTERHQRYLAWHRAERFKG